VTATASRPPSGAAAAATGWVATPTAAALVVRVPESEIARLLPHARALARRRAARARADADELESAAAFALLRAAMSFDSSRGASFKTYASIRMASAIADSLRKTFGRGYRRSRPVSLELVAPRDRRRSSLEAIAEEDSLEDLLGPLSPRSRTILRDRYVRGRTHREIGEDLGLSESRVCQLEAAALEVLRVSLRTTCAMVVPGGRSCA